jgi:arylsulfatase A-like enzyme
MWFPRRHRFVWHLLGVLLLSACSSAPGRPNILIVVIDTLRADRLGVYGNSDQLTPFLDSLAQRSCVFENAYAASSWTKPSIASLFTSRYPSQHTVETLASALPASELTFAEVLQHGGYVTGGFSAHLMITQGKSGFDQGFDVFQFAGASLAPRGPSVNGQALAWLDSLSDEQRSAPVFLFVHYMEPHIPYEPPREIVQRVLKRRERSENHRRSIDQILDDWTTIVPRIKAHESEDLAILRDLYDAEVSSVDRDLRALFVELESRGFLRNALVVITSDHGEAFLDHGHIGHGRNLYNELIRVPLLLLLPGSGQQTRVTDVISLLDVAPTLLREVGIALPPAFEGRFLYEAAGAACRTPTTAAAVSELGSRSKRRGEHDHAVVIGSEKVIVTASGEVEGYDLQGDPHERDPDGLDDAARLRLLQAVEEIRRDVGGGAKEEAMTLDAGARRQLRALGYVD